MGVNLGHEQLSHRLDSDPVKVPNFIQNLKFKLLNIQFRNFILKLDMHTDTDSQSVD